MAHSRLRSSYPFSKEKWREVLPPRPIPYTALHSHTAHCHAMPLLALPHHARHHHYYGIAPHTVKCSPRRDGKHTAPTICTLPGEQLIKTRYIPNGSTKRRNITFDHIADFRYSLFKTPIYPCSHLVRHSVECLPDRTPNLIRTRCRFFDCRYDFWRFLARGMTLY